MDKNSSNLLVDHVFKSQDAIQLLFGVKLPIQVVFGKAIAKSHVFAYCATVHIDESIVTLFGINPVFKGLYERGLGGLEFHMLIGRGIQKDRSYLDKAIEPAHGVCHQHARGIEPK